MVTIQHVKRHQDDVAQFDELSRWAQLNVLVDQEAKKRLLEFLCKAETLDPPLFTGKGGHVGWVKENVRILLVSVYIVGFFRTRRDTTGL